MTTDHKLYIPAGQWIVETLTSFCEAYRIGNASISGIGSITDIWVLVYPDDGPVVRNFSVDHSSEMTSLIGNVTLRQGMPMFDKSGLPTGKYPQIDTSIRTFNCYAHVHVTFATPEMSILGGHLLDALVSIGAEIVVDQMAEPACTPGLLANQIPNDCVTDVDVDVPRYGCFSNWDQRFWYPPQSDNQKN